ncbi:MAG: EAL domain-containing protein [Porticoccaceae bacterium]
MRVLVVDDNRTNQQITVAMLHNLGCQSEVACSGVEAIDAVHLSTIDLILMNCNMPHMNGYETSQQLRARENSEVRELPIIAMTTDNLIIEFERCKRAGINDLLPKPLKLSVLREQLEKWTSYSAVHSKSVWEPKTDYSAKKPDDTDKTLKQNVAKTPHNQPADEERFPLSYDLSVLAALRHAVGDALGYLISVFQEDMVMYLDDLDKAIASDDVAKIRMLAHTIKGSASNFGAYRLVKCSKELENRVVTNNIDNARAYADQIDAAFRAFNADLERDVLPSAQAEQVVVGPKEKRNRILVVDDDRSNRLLLVNAFMRENYEIAEAANGTEAIKVCQQRMPDLILMDALMPEMDGFDACKSIRDLPLGADIPVLMITGLEDEGSIIKAFSSGTTDYISKPINFSVLKQRAARLISASKAENYIKSLAFYDPLTGLPNRSNLMEYLQMLVDHSVVKDDKFAILFLDLDHFKMINDSMGHVVGDQLLKAIADRLRNNVRHHDFVVRIGGDEFTLILQKINSSESAGKVAEKICHAIRKPFLLMGKKIHITVSVGISIFPDNGSDVRDLIKYADSSMFKAKEKRNGFCFYKVGMKTEVTERLEMEAELAHAIKHDQLNLVYQPKVDFHTGRLVGAEALVRWDHPRKLNITPDVFIPLAEESGLINQLGDWVLETGVKQLKQWLDRGSSLTLAINLSMKELIAGNLYARLEAAIKSNQLPENVLELEITETVLMSQPEFIGTELAKIKALGVSIAIDDFGCGYSSLSYLKNLPIDVLKIDRSFVQDIESEASDVAIVTGIVALAKTLDMTTVAEGVETASQRAALKRLGCDCYQGYLTAAPLPAESFEAEFLRLS